MADAQYKIVFADHSVHESLKEAREAFASLPDEMRREAEEEGHDPEDWLSRLEPILNHIGALLGAADPALVNTATLDGCQQQIDQIKASLNALRDNQEWAQLPTIQSNEEGLLNTALQFAPAVGIWGKDGVEEAVGKLGEAAAAKSRSLQGQFGNLQGRLNQLKEETDQEFAALKEKADEKSAQMDAQLETLTTEVTAEKTRLDETTKTFEAQFTEAEDERGNTFDEARKELADKNKEAIDALKAANEEAEAAEKARAYEAIESLKASGNEIIDFLNDKKDQAAKLIDLVATSSTAGAFGKEATEQREAADRWRKGAVAIAAVAGLIGVLAVVLSFAYDASTAEQIGKAFTVAVLLSVAAYAANQSSQHRRREQRAKRLELELVAFGPFTEPLDPTEQNQVRKELIERMFVGDPGGEEKHPADGNGLSNEDFNLMTQVVRLIKEGQK